ncbi:uncharacterized protein IWZ02DRAFT_152493 [Phyllosticta citriasiana]|uniref:uncharacterized protein n=1 Tax=Phyllosticta citriasiana TaxID=595635 RepID=UPI0030FDC7A0
MQGSGGHPTHVEIFEALRDAKRTWLRGEYIAASFSLKLLHRRSSLEKEFQRAMENTVWKFGSAYGTSEFGATIIFDTHAGSGVSTKITKGGFWNLESEHARAPIARLWTDKKTAENLDLIRELEERYKKPVAMISDTPELQVRKALAIPTALLNKIVTLARDFALILSLYQLQDLLRGKWEENERVRCDATNPHCHSLTASDVSELIQETLKSTKPLNPGHDELFEEWAAPETPTCEQQLRCGAIGATREYRSQRERHGPRDAVINQDCERTVV